MRKGVKYENDLLLFEAECARLENGKSIKRILISIKYVLYAHGQIKVCKDSLLS